LQRDHLSSGLRPLVCLAGTLDSFRDSADDLLRRFVGVRLCATTVRAATQRAGEQLAQRQQQGDIVRVAAERPWDFRIPEQTATAAFVGLDAFSVPMQKSGGAKAEHRMLYTAVLYTPDKSGHHYLVDFDLDRLGRQMRRAASRLGLGRAEQLLAISDAGNGLEEALRRHFRDDLVCILDWYHASEHLHAYARCRPGGEGEVAGVWVKRMKDILYEQGGCALVKELRQEPAPAAAEVAEELRKLVNYFAGNEHRTDYPSYRAKGWDIGSGPTEAACKVVGARLKESGMRWLEAGAEKVGPLRALYLSGPETWDAFWAMAA
jgi:hypothetical protein